LVDIYGWALARQFPLPRPPIDADLNNNGIPDVNEPRLWNFEQQLGYATVGSARIQNYGYELTPASSGRTGGVYLTTPITQVPWRFEFEFAIGSGTSTPADGLAFSFDPTLTLTAGGGLGLPPNLNGGFAVALDTYNNGSALTPELQIRQGTQGATTFFGETNVLAKSPATPELLSDQWQKATVSYDGTTISATFGSTTVSAPFTLTPNNYYAKVVAATGFFYNQHKMRNPVFIPLYREELAEAARSLTDSPPLPPVELLQPNPDHT
jgi:hypothetical protein